MLCYPFQKTGDFWLIGKGGMWIGTNQEGNAGSNDVPIPIN